MQAQKANPPRSTPKTRHTWNTVGVRSAISLGQRNKRSSKDVIELTNQYRIRRLVYFIYFFFPASALALMVSGFLKGVEAELLKTKAPALLIASARPKAFFVLTKLSEIVFV